MYTIHYKYLVLSTNLNLLSLSGKTVICMYKQQLVPRHTCMCVTVVAV